MFFSHTTRTGPIAHGNKYCSPQRMLRYRQTKTHNEVSPHRALVNKPGTRFQRVITKDLILFQTPMRLTSHADVDESRHRTAAEVYP